MQLKLTLTPLCGDGCLKGWEHQDHRLQSNPLHHCIIEDHPVKEHNPHILPPPGLYTGSAKGLKADIQQLRRRFAGVVSTLQPVTCSDSGE